MSANLRPLTPPKSNVVSTDLRARSLTLPHRESLSRVDLSTPDLDLSYLAPPNRGPAPGGGDPIAPDPKAADLESVNVSTSPEIGIRRSPLRDLIPRS